MNMHETPEEAIANSPGGWLATTPELAQQMAAKYEAEAAARQARK